jgi:hypothetical protein
MVVNNTHVVIHITHGSKQHTRSDTQLQGN